MRVGDNTKSDWVSAIAAKTVTDLGHKLTPLARFLTIVKPGQQRGRPRTKGQERNDYEWVRIVRGNAKRAYNVPKGMSIKP